MMITIEQYEELKKQIADYEANKNNNDNNNDTDGISEMANQKEEKVITKLQDVSREFVESYIEKASLQDAEWIASRSKELQKEKGELKYFMTFRPEFVRKFFPELIGQKKKKASVSMVEVLEQKLRQRKGGN